MSSRDAYLADGFHMVWCQPDPLLAAPPHLLVTPLTRSVQAPHEQTVAQVVAAEEDAELPQVDCCHRGNLHVNKQLSYHFAGTQCTGNESDCQMLGHAGISSMEWLLQAETLLDVTARPMHPRMSRRSVSTDAGATTAVRPTGGGLLQLVTLFVSAGSPL